MRPYLLTRQLAQVPVIDGADPIEADKVLVAVGRRPNSSGLGLEDVGVEVDQRGRVVVNEKFATNVPGVYAIGDLIAGPMLAHKASEDGVALVEMLAGQAAHVDYDLVPGVVYTEPEVAGVGKTEEQLKEGGVPYRRGSFPFLANGRARAISSTDGKVKVLAHAQSVAAASFLKPGSVGTSRLLRIARSVLL